MNNRLKQFNSPTEMSSIQKPLITICIPHWQVERYIKVCLRSIRKHSQNYDIEVIVVDNGSKDESIDYLRTLQWIRLIERPEEVHTNWPRNVFTAWDCGLKEATGDYYITMHSDVFIKADDWLKPFLKTIQSGPTVAASGSDKLEIVHPLYALQKRIFGTGLKHLKSKLFGKKVRLDDLKGQYPRDYCAMYTTKVLVDHDIRFLQNLNLSGGYQVAKQLLDKGFTTKTFPVIEMDRILAHIAHRTAAVAPEKKLGNQHKQNKTHSRYEDVFALPWIRELEMDTDLDK